jgi:thiamine biosynthesis lipoprotein
MGMPVTVQVVDAEADEQAMDKVFNEFRLLDRTFSPFLADSEVSRINRGELRPENAGQLVNQAIDLCRLYEQATEGYFSAWISGRFDPSGLIKGWAIDRACSILDRYGLRDYFVDAGGDVQTRGQNPDRGPGRAGSSLVTLQGSPDISSSSRCKRPGRKSRALQDLWHSLAPITPIRM